MKSRTRARESLHSPAATGADFQGIAPTGKQVRIPVMLIYRIADGRIAQSWMNADSLGLLTQLGAIPSP